VLPLPVVKRLGTVKVAGRVVGLRDELIACRCRP
jgi:hypothetical protein